VAVAVVVAEAVAVAVAVAVAGDKTATGVDTIANEFGEVGSMRPLVTLSAKCNSSNDDLCKDGHAVMDV
jgi:hypothetical protein